VAFITVVCFPTAICSSTAAPSFPGIFKYAFGDIQCIQLRNNRTKSSLEDEEEVDKEKIDGDTKGIGY
jgi:hypothetical protein